MGYHSENKRSLGVCIPMVEACVLEHKSVVNMLDVKLLQVRKMQISKGVRGSDTGTNSHTWAEKDSMMTSH